MAATAKESHWNAVVVKDFRLDLLCICIEKSARIFFKRSWTKQCRVVESDRLLKRAFDFFTKMFLEEGNLLTRFVGVTMVLVLKYILISLVESWMVVYC